MAAPAQVTIVLAAPPGLQREALRSLLRALAGTRVVGVHGDLGAALEAVRRDAPQVLLMDTRLAPAGEATMRRIRSAAGVLRCVVVVDGPAQEQDWLATGADAILTRGCIDDLALRMALAPGALPAG